MEGPCGLRVHKKVCIVFRVAPVHGETKNPHFEAGSAGVLVGCLGTDRHGLFVGLGVLAGCGCCLRTQ